MSIVSELNLTDTSTQFLILNPSSTGFPNSQVSFQNSLRFTSQTLWLLCINYVSPNLFKSQICCSLLLKWEINVFEDSTSQFSFGAIKLYWQKQVIEGRVYFGFGSSSGVHDNEQGKEAGS